MTTSPIFRLVRLDKKLDRSSFCSGSKPLDDYFQKQITQDIRRRIAVCFVAISHDKKIAGYYTLSSASVDFSSLPDETRRKLPRYPTVPMARMGRLAIDEQFKGQGLGGALLADALARVGRSEIAAYALVVDAKDKNAADFYRHHGFIELPDSPLVLFLPLSTVSSLK